MTGTGVRQKSGKRRKPRKIFFPLSAWIEPRAAALALVRQLLLHGTVCHRAGKECSSGYFWALVTLPSLFDSPAQG